MECSGRFRFVVLLTLLVQSLCSGLVVPVLPALLQRFSVTSLASDSAPYGWSVAAFAIGTFTFSPLMGQLADRFGRRPVVLMSLAGAVLDYAIGAVTTNLWVFITARFFAGALAAGASAVQAAVADLTSPRDRARQFAAMGAAYGGGLVLGPAAGGFAGELAPPVAFWIAAITSAVALLLAALMFRETLPAVSRRPFAMRRTNPLSSLIAIGHLRFRGLLTVFAILSIGLGLADPVVILFMQRQLHWRMSSIGLFMSLGGIGLMVSRLVLTPRAVARLGQRMTILCGMASLLIYSALYQTITQGWQMCLVASLLLLGSVTIPTLTAALSHDVEANAQGELQGLLWSLQAASGIVGPPIGTTVFSYFVGSSSPLFLPAAPFLLSSAFVALAMVIFLRLRDSPMTVETNTRGLMGPE